MHGRPSRYICIYPPPGWPRTNYLFQDGSWQVLQVQGVMGNCREEFVASPINSCPMSRGETANVGSDAGRLNINNNMPPFE